MIPYVFFSMFNSALKFGVLLITHKLTNEALHDELIALFITGNGTVWFLPTLFIAEIVFFETDKYKILRYTLAIAGLIVPYLLRESINPVLLVIVRALYGFSYIVIGFLLWEWFRKKAYAVKKENLLLLGFLLFALGCLGAYVFDYKIAFMSGSFVNGPAAIPVSVIFSIGIILCMYAIQDKSNIVLNVLQYYGKESLLVMLLHTTILLFCTYPLEGWFRSLLGLNSFVASMVVFAIVAACNVPIIAVINRWFPILKGELKAKRGVLSYQGTPIHRE